MVKSIICSFLLATVFITSCNNGKADAVTAKGDSAHCCMSVPSRFGNSTDTSVMQFSGDTSVTGMVLIPGGTFDMGGDNERASADEYPKHKVQVSPFYMDVTEVTNAQFKKFVDATGYITTAEKTPDWEELKKTVPPGTAKPPDSVMVAASLVFKQTSGQVNLNDYSQWWQWVKGANWKHPQDPQSSIVGKEN